MAGSRVKGRRKAREEERKARWLIWSLVDALAVTVRHLNDNFAFVSG